LIEVEALEQARRDLCIAAELLDRNKQVHTLLRLAKGDARLKLKGHLGGAMYLLTIAETLRRATEKANGILLPEEDELGFGWTPLDMKKNLYGSNRLLDGDRKAAGEFLRDFRLDYGIRLRCYVEGDTEYYALKALLDDYNATWVQLINLSGQVVEKRGRGIAFRESLRNDLNAHIFSCVVVDLI
jgi:hypothetical protein